MKKLATYRGVPAWMRGCKYHGTFSNLGWLDYQINPNNRCLRLYIDRLHKFRKLTGLAVGDKFTSMLVPGYLMFVGSKAPSTGKRPNQASLIENPGGVTGRLQAALGDMNDVIAEKFDHKKPNRVEATRIHVYTTPDDEVVLLIEIPDDDVEWHALHEYSLDQAVPVLVRCKTKLADA